MNRIPLKKVKTPEEIMREASELNNYDLDKIQSAQAQEDVIFQPGTFRVSMATLHHGKPRNEHPIGDFIQRIYLFEDMEKFGLTGWIDMLDTYNLVRNSLILGEELLY